MKNITQLEGLGVRIYSEDGETFMDLLFEIDDAAIDGETGLAVPTGMRRILRLQDGAKLRSLAEYEAIVVKLCEVGYPDQGIPPGSMRPISWNDFTRKGYDLRM